MPKLMTKKPEKKAAQSQFWKDITNTVLSKMNGLAVFFVVYIVYMMTVFPTVQTEDSGELITSALSLDIAHPPGYPLYVLVGKLFSYLIPFGNMAWRINLMSAVFGAGTAQLIYLVVKKRTKNELIAFGGALFYAFTNLIWGQSNRGEVYTLNTFCLALIIYLFMRWHDAQPAKAEKETAKSNKSNIWLYLIALTFGLGIGDHHLLLLAAPAMGLYVIIKNWKVLINPKVVLGSLALLALGLSVYAYIPIRTYVAPYDNPAFIDHTGLYTWDKFINFVNRKIYGGTVDIPTDDNGGNGQVAPATPQLPTWVIGIKDFFINYGTRLIDNNANSFIPLMKIIFSEYLFLPLFFFLPGVYYIFKKDKKWGAFIFMLFLCYTVLLMVFTPIDADTSDFIAFSTQPFMMPAMMIVIIIVSEGFTWLCDNITNKKLAIAFSTVCLIPATVALGRNFTNNNESKNFLAYDFNKLTLESVPQNGYLISIGRDNMTFPLYYLRKIENVRPDIQLEIYYSTAPVDEVFLQSRVAKNNGKPVFIDLLPGNYASMGLKPYNFVYEYGNDPSIPKPTMQDPKVRGIRQYMDFPDVRLKMLYYIKTGIMETDPVKKQAAFNEVFKAPGDNSYWYNIIGDYEYTIGDFEDAQKAYQLANNEYGVEKTNDRVNNPDHWDDENIQNGMS